jgi:hypothetical protein
MLAWVKQILVQNVADVAQSHWVFAALPSQEIPANGAGCLLDERGTKYPWASDPHGIRILASLPARTTARLTMHADTWAEPAFALHPAIASGLDRLLPVVAVGGVAIPGPAYSLQRSNNSVQVWHMRWHHAVQRITVDLWATIHTQQATIEYVCQAVYGTTANDGQPQVQTFPALTLSMQTQFVRDFATRNGQPQAAWNEASQSWSMVLVPAGSWHRAVRYETRGAILPMPDPARLQGRPMQALYTGWDGQWLALGIVPEATPEIRQTRAQQLLAYLTPQAGRYSDARPRCQPRESGTTGDQPDFGAASDLAATTMDPWEIHDALWQVQSYMQRPTANREPGGAPMQAQAHPMAETMNQRPDLSYGVRDRLGWPNVNQIAWIPSPATTLWTTGDDQHRSDGFMHAAFLLTRDPALEQLILDHIELDRTDIYTRTGWVPSPRSIGRLALARANQVWLGFTEAKAVLVQALRNALAQTPFGTLPEGATVRTLGGREQAKYGWADSNGQAVIGWQPWQETIAMIGLRAAARVLGDVQFADAASQLALTVVDQAFQFSASRQMAHAYAIRWNNGQPYSVQQWPAQAWSQTESQNNMIYTSNACQSWTVAAAHVLRGAEQKADDVIANMPHPRNMQEARWRAL